MRMISAHAGDIMATELIVALWHNFNDRVRKLKTTFFNEGCFTVRTLGRNEVFAIFPLVYAKDALVDHPLARVFRSNLRSCGHHECRLRAIPFLVLSKCLKEALVNLPANSTLTSKHGSWVKQGLLTVHRVQCSSFACFVLLF
uniref:Reverse transcriptase n=1 Tax=Heterorhabditis bacteriophora TaxID=37862 RepID=A0A1I7X072_HETBA